MALRRERSTRKRRPIAPALSIFWQFFIFYFLIFLLSISVLLVFLIPKALNAARVIDQGSYDNLMEETGQYVQDVLSEVDLVKSRLEHSEWFQDLFFKNIARGDALTAAEKEEIRGALTEYTTQSPTISMVAFVFDGDDTLYNQFTIISDWRKYQKYDVTASLKYRFFPMEAGQAAGLSIQPYMVSDRKFSALAYRSTISNLVHSNWNRPKGVINIMLNTYTFCPEKRDDLRGALIGLSARSTRWDAARAVMEGVCFQTAWMMETFGAARYSQIRMTGGAVNSTVWIQMMADIAGCSISVPAVADAGCMGAAALAGVASGLFPSIEEAIRLFNRSERIVRPDAHQALYQALFDQYKRNYACLSRFQRMNCATI